MEEVCGDATLCYLVRDVLKARGWEVREEYLPTARQLPANILREIPYC